MVSRQSAPFSLIRFTILFAGFLTMTAACNFLKTDNTKNSGEITHANQSKQKFTMLKHPGFIVSVEYPGGIETKKPVEGIPIEHQFIFLKEGEEVGTADQADTIIPIVRVEIHFSEDKKRILEINEMGPGAQSLRRTYGAR